MKKVENMQRLKGEVDAYEKHFTGAPLLIGMDSNDTYRELVGLLGDDAGKQILRASDACAADFPPDPVFQISQIRAAAQQKPVVWLGAAQAKMLYGQQETERFLINLLGASFPGPVTVLCPFCCGILEGIGRRYEKLGLQIIVAASGERCIPSIQVRPDDGISYADAIRGIKALLRRLEDGAFAQTISLLTSCKFSYLESSMFPVSQGATPYQLLCRLEPSIAASTTESNGTSEQWRGLAQEVQRAGGLSALCAERLCGVQNLRTDFGDYLLEDADQSFLCFVCLKVFCGSENDYLAHCLRKTETVDELEKNLYMCILDLDHDDTKFAAWTRQRRQILAGFDENSALMATFCARATVKGKNILWYLSDRTDEERAAIIHALCCYDYTLDELNVMLKEASPQLAAYLQPFTFDEFNTRVMESDAPLRAMLTDYFQRYKLQKLTNHQDRDFVEMVEAEARERSFTKLQARSAIVQKLGKKGAQPYFFDALGVEFLAFMQAKAKEYGMLFECLVGHCNLPSITSENKEFYDAFPPDSILKEDGLDDIKHKGTKFNFQFTTEPLHIFAELDLLDKDLKKMRSILASNQCQRIIILSDHGASRLAVTYKSENDKLQLAEPGKHSGRCCPAEEDPNIEFVIHENGFAVLANYERFKGSRKADVEAHGGATLEETVVPVIVLTLQPKDREIYFLDETVLCSAKGSRIHLFANPSLQNPRMVVKGQSYIGKFAGDHHNVIFDMPDIRRQADYACEIYDGGVKVADLKFTTERLTGTNYKFGFTR